MRLRLFLAALAVIVFALPAAAGADDPAAMSPYLKAQVQYTVQAAHLKPGMRYRVVLETFMGENDVTPGYMSVSPLPVGPTGITGVSVPAWLLLSAYRAADDNSAEVGYPYKLRVWLFEDPNGDYLLFGVPALDTGGNQLCMEIDVLEPPDPQPCPEALFSP